MWNTSCQSAFINKKQRLAKDNCFFNGLFGLHNLANHTSLHPILWGLSTAPNLTINKPISIHIHFAFVVVVVVVGGLLFHYFCRHGCTTHEHTHTPNTVISYNNVEHGIGLYILFSFRCCRWSVLLLLLLVGCLISFSVSTNHHTLFFIIIIRCVLFLCVCFVCMIVRIAKRPSHFIYGSKLIIKQKQKQKQTSKPMTIKFYLPERREK